MKITEGVGWDVLRNLLLLCMCLQNIRIYDSIANKTNAQFQISGSKKITFDTPQLSSTFLPYVKYTGAMIVGIASRLTDHVTASKISVLRLLHATL